MSRGSVNNGSSPLVRGKLGRSSCRSIGFRLIPAGAGKTDRGPQKDKKRGAHPRWCGENNLHITVATPHSGSSPLVRGKPASPWVFVLWHGLIPAGAGKTPSRTVRSASRRAHPRWCGENIVPTRRIPMRGGSSPLVRGKQAGCERHLGAGGLIPAGAGKTSHVFVSRFVGGAHPRWCGENFPCVCLPFCWWGSSPLVRGKRFTRGDTAVPDGLIPAGAGKTSLWSAITAFHAAHPRWCGENWAKPCR
ncbi:Domain of uncharacterised function (DUF2825) [Corynebacterium diphtheriae]|nr:Domain of uncharacterised function (DUF2825) [Corynebacterium diphtheriae]